MDNFLLSGHSGFLGSHILEVLVENHKKVVTIGRNKNSQIIFDYKNKTKQKINSSYVIHTAGIAHRRNQKLNNFEELHNINVIGTKNLLDSLNFKTLKTFIFISSVSVYGKETGVLVDEKEPLLGSSAYARSKIEAEKVILKYANKFNFKYIILRLPLVTGKNAPGNLGRIDKYIKKGFYLRIGEGESKRSIISAYDVANSILEMENLNGIFNLTDVHNPRIKDIDSTIARNYNKKVFKVPTKVSLLFFKVGDFFSFIPFNSNDFKKLTAELTFSNQKILKEINYKPINGLSDLCLKKNLN